MQPARMTRTLILNATGEPLTLVSTMRALRLILKGTARQLECELNHPIRTATHVFDRPLVIQLATYRHIPYRVPAYSGRRVLNRDDYRCQYCGSAASEVDHVMPRCRGGRSSWDNCVAVCRRCNLRKANRTPAEAGMPLYRMPKAPDPTALIGLEWGALSDTFRHYLPTNAA